MEIKTNKSTDLRPEGDRILDAPLVEIDLKQHIENIKDERTWKEGSRNAITVFKTDGMRIVLIGLHESTEMTKHIAKGIISVQVIHGHIRFQTDDRTIELTEGKMIALHKGIYHSVTAVKKSVFLLTIAD